MLLSVGSRRVDTAWCCGGATCHLGFDIIESSDAVPIGEWMQVRTDLLSFEITLLLTDEEVAEIIG